MSNRMPPRFHRMLGRCLLAGALGLAALFPPDDAAAQGRLRLVRDAEIEHIIRTYATPLFQAGGLDPRAVRIVLVHDDTLNAFVAQGQNLFINTGLLKRARSANQVMGVIAHETGHMTGGHLARLREQMDQAFWKSILATVVSIGAGVAAGRGDVAMAGNALGSNIIMRDILSFSRAQESSADQAGLRYLDGIQQSARGMAEFFQILSGQELLLADRQDPYVRTHPLSTDRLQTILAHVAQSPYSSRPEPPGFAEMHARTQAKIIAYLDPRGTVFRIYRESDPSIAARYGRAIGFMINSDHATALIVIDGLLKERPNDPFFHEMKGEILMNGGRVLEAVEPYRRAVELLPDNALLRLEYGTALVQAGSVPANTNDPRWSTEAIRQLQESNRFDNDNPSVWYQLARAYGLGGNIPLANLAQAEGAALVGNDKEAREFANRALRGLSQGSAGWLRAQDILATIKKPS
jgi:predicted Zn-dependent protease